MLTSQLRECKQMEGCVPKGGTAPRVIAIAKLVSLRIFICECSQREKSMCFGFSLKDRNAVANALKNVEARQERGNLHTNTKRAKNKYVYRLRYKKI